MYLYNHIVSVASIAGLVDEIEGYFAMCSGFRSLASIDMFMMSSYGLAAGYLQT